MLLNISSYGGGSNLWGSPDDDLEFSTPSPRDGKLEVVGITGSLQLAAAQLSLGRPLRLCQGRHISICVKRKVAAQIDGEPCHWHPGKVEVGLLNQSFMLSPASSHSHRVALQVLHRAVDEGVIDRNQHDWMVSCLASSTEEMPEE